MNGAFDTRHGWDLYQHPAFREIFERLVGDVAEIAASSPHRVASHAKAKLLRRLTDLILDEIPHDPGAARYRQGLTLPVAYRHWRRAKLLGRFRLFFRYSSRQRAIIYGWINDEASLRKAGARTDAYAVFARRLRTGNPPNDWDDLKRQAGG